MECLLRTFSNLIESSLQNFAKIQRGLNSIVRVAPGKDKSSSSLSTGWEFAETWDVYCLCQSMHLDWFRFKLGQIAMLNSIKQRKIWKFLRYRKKLSTWVCSRSGNAHRKWRLRHERCSRIIRRSLNTQRAQEGCGDERESCFHVAVVCLGWKIMRRSARRLSEDFPLLVVVSKNKFMLSHKMNPIKFSLHWETHSFRWQGGLRSSFSFSFFLLSTFPHSSMSSSSHCYFCTSYSDDDFSSFSHFHCCCCRFLSFSFCHLLDSRRRLRCHRRSFARHE